MIHQRDAVLLMPLYTAYDAYQHHLPPSVMNSTQHMQRTGCGTGRTILEYGEIIHRIKLIVIEANNICYSDELESKFLEGNLTADS